MEEYVWSIMDALVNQNSNSARNAQVATDGRVYSMDLYKFGIIISAFSRSDGTKRIPGNALVAMTLLIAESRPQEKDLLTRVLVHLIRSEKP